MNNTPSLPTNHLRRESRYFISRYGRVTFFQAKEELTAQQNWTQETTNLTTETVLSRKLRILMSDLDFSEKDAYRFIQFTALSQLTQTAQGEDGNERRSLN